MALTEPARRAQAYLDEVGAALTAAQSSGPVVNASASAFREWCEGFARPGGPTLPGPLLARWQQEDPTGLTRALQRLRETALATVRKLAVQRFRTRHAGARALVVDLDA